MIYIYINTLKSTIDNKDYYPIILNKLHIEILKQYVKYYNVKCYNDEYIAKDIITHYLSAIEYDLILYHKNYLKNYYKKQINIDAEYLLNYLNKIKDEHCK